VTPESFWQSTGAIWILIGGAVALSIGTLFFPKLSKMNLWITRMQKAEGYADAAKLNETDKKEAFSVLGQYYRSKDAKVLQDAATKTDETRISEPYRTDGSTIDQTGLRTFYQLAILDALKERSTEQKAGGERAGKSIWRRLGRFWGLPLMLGTATLLYGSNTLAATSYAAHASYGTLAAWALGLLPAGLGLIIYSLKGQRPPPKDTAIGFNPKGGGSGKPYSPTMIMTYLKSKHAPASKRYVEFVKKYLFQLHLSVNPTTIAAQLVMGKCVHEALEKVHIAIKMRKPLKDFDSKDILATYDRIWNEHVAEEKAAGRRLVTRGRLNVDDYRRGGREYIKIYWDMMMSGKLLDPERDDAAFIEHFLHFNLTDNKSGKAYKFLGLPDLGILQVRTDGQGKVTRRLVIQDMKTHMGKLSKEEIDLYMLQLCTYVIGIQEEYPDPGIDEYSLRLVTRRGVIERVVDEALLRDTRNQMLSSIKEIEGLIKDVEKDKDAWRLRFGLKIPIPTTKQKRASFVNDNVDRLVALENERLELNKLSKSLDNQETQARQNILDLAKAKDAAILETSDGQIEIYNELEAVIPTKKDAPKENAELEDILRASSYWPKLSVQDHRALKAVADSKGKDDPQLWKRVKRFFSNATVRGVSLSDETLKRIKKDAKAASGALGLVLIFLGATLYSPLAQATVSALPTTAAALAPLALIAVGAAIGLIPRAKKPRPFSHSMLKTFEYSKANFVQRYLQKRNPKEVPVFLVVGSAAHAALEEFHILIKNGAKPTQISREQTLVLYDKAWDKTIAEFHRKGMSLGLPEEHDFLTAADWKCEGRHWVANYWDRFQRGEIVELE
ncbi:MAG: PD-(D/E)XK nuclease family protein, partial [Elusimicrobiota bacterium]